MTVDPAHTATHAADPTTVWLGSVIILVALTLVAIMVAWSRRAIERIAARRLTSARDIERDREKHVRT